MGVVGRKPRSRRARESHGLHARQGGADRIKGGAGDDCLRGGRGRDRISGGEGDDKIHVRGGRRDRVKCGPGKDTVVASASDRVGKSCEKVKD